MATHGRYRITRKIADGGMAEIFLGTQHGAEGFQRPVVLKRILAALLADPQFRNMMIDEAYVAMSLNHSNIVQVLDLGQSKGRYFLVLEFVDGWDLNHVLARLKAAGVPLPPELALYIVAEVCRALAYAHAKTRDGQHLGIVHRDVSPQNVLISEQGEVKLTDFGIAKATGRREHTGQGIIKGKLAFMSPEQASGGTLDARSDLFSVGTLLYLMITGRRPFEAPTDIEGFLRVQQCSFPPPAEVKPDIEPKLATIILRAMRAAAADRYQSAEELLIDLEAAQRTIFQPAGQTELKRWLADLATKDKGQPISRSRPAPDATTPPELDLVEGADVIFDDAPPDSAPTVIDKAASATRPVHATGHRRTAIIAGGAALAVAAAALLWPRTSKPPASPRHARTIAPPVTVAPVPKVAPAPVAIPDAAIAALPVAPAPAPVAVTNPEDDEDTLLKRTEPDAEQAIIGEEAQAAPAHKRARRANPAAAQTVSVRITSKPDGAVIRLKTRIFGRTPLNLRFRSGITYELQFVKSGYATASKTFTVTTQKSQHVAATMRKAPAKKQKSFLKRLFGG